MEPKHEQKGELIVRGKDKVEIMLKDFPHRIHVVFKPKADPAPCDPHHHTHTDTLSWEVHRKRNCHDHYYTLVIKWNVSSIRDIVWHAFY